MSSAPVPVHGCVGRDGFAVLAVAGVLAGRGSFTRRTVVVPPKIFRIAGLQPPAYPRASPVCLPGETMRIASSEFADDPCSSVKRGTMVRAARALLSAVTRLLILADMADVMRLLSHLKIVRMQD